MQTFLNRAAKGELRWTLAPYPTNAFAQDAEMRLADYEDFLYSACMPDMDDPIGYWKKFAAVAGQNRRVAERQEAGAPQGERNRPEAQHRRADVHQLPRR